MQNAERRTREWETLRACERYDFDPILDGAMERIWAASDEGKNYNNEGVTKRDMICVLNYLDGLATGIQQNLYIDSIIKDHMSLVIDTHVRKFLVAGLVEKEGFETLLAVHARWFLQTKPPEYQSQTARAGGR